MGSVFFNGALQFLTGSDSIVKAQSELPAPITPRLLINCQMSSCCTEVPSRTSKTRDERAATANWGSPHPRGWGAGGGFMGRGSDSLELYSRGDLPIKAPLPGRYQRQRRGHSPGLFIQLQAHLINAGGETQVAVLKGPARHGPAPLLRHKKGAQM